MRHSRILCCPRQPSTFSVYPQIKERRLSSSITFLPVTCRRKTVEHMIWDLETFHFCFRREDVQTEPFYDDNSDREKNLPGWPSEKVNKPAFLPACPLPITFPLNICCVMLSRLHHTSFGPIIQDTYQKRQKRP